MSNDWMTAKESTGVSILFQSKFNTLHIATWNESLKKRKYVHFVDNYYGR